MFEVKPEQMELIVSSFTKPIEEQKLVIETLGFSSNDYVYADTEFVDALCAIPKNDFDIEEVLASPLDYLENLTDARKAELKEGAKVTADELEKYYKTAGEMMSQGEVYTFAVILTFTDGKREAFGLFIDIMMGPGGSEFIDFFGLFDTYAEADAARDNIADYVIV